jgi:hypothetical protein
MSSGISPLGGSASLLTRRLVKIKWDLRPTGEAPQTHGTGFWPEPYAAGFQSFASDAATPRALYRWTTRPSLAARTSPRQRLGSC